MKGKMIIDGNSVYDIDEKCLCQKEKGAECKYDLDGYEAEKKETADFYRDFKEMQEKTGLTGKGIGVAILDSGAEPHPDFADRIVGFADFVHPQKWKKTGYEKDSARYTYDDLGHGTHICGIIGGNGRMSKGEIVRGVAPECLLFPVKVVDKSGFCKKGDLYAGIDFVIKNAKRFGIRIVNLSLGAQPEERNAEYSRLVKETSRLWDAGLVVCVAAGNLGAKAGSVATPGINRKLITVGAFDDDRTQKGSLKQGYSGRGPTENCILKPEVVMRGTHVLSTSADFVNGKRGKPYEYRSGTSMAAPFVSGAAALLLEKDPSLTNVQVKCLIRKNCVSLGLSGNHQGWGRLNLKTLLN